MQSPNVLIKDQNTDFSKSDLHGCYYFTKKIFLLCFISIADERNYKD